MSDRFERVVRQAAVDAAARAIAADTLPRGCSWGSLSEGARQAYRTIASTALDAADDAEYAAAREYAADVECETT